MVKQSKATPHIVVTSTDTAWGGSNAMTQQKSRVKFTVDDYMSMPENGKRYELLNGEMVLAPSPTPKHQSLQNRLVAMFLEIFELRGLGRIWGAPLDVIFADNDIAQPDLMFVSNERAAIVTAANIRGAPDLVVEILSPGTAAYDRGYKRTLYGRHGVRELWLVEPVAETVEVFIGGQGVLVEYASYGNTGELTTPLMQGASIDLAELFRVS